MKKRKGGGGAKHEGISSFHRNHPVQRGGLPTPSDERKGKTRLGGRVGKFKATTKNAKNKKNRLTQREKKALPKKRLQNVRPLPKKGPNQPKVAPNAQMERKQLRLGKGGKIHHLIREPSSTERKLGLRRDPKKGEKGP